MVRAGSDSEVMETHSQGRHVNSLYLPIKITISAGRREFEVHIGLRAAQAPVTNPFFDPLKSFVHSRVTVGIGVAGVLAPQPACLQVDRESAFVGDVVQPVPELM